MAIKRGNPKDRKSLACGTRQWREAQELEVPDCADLLGISDRHLEYLESGQRRASVDLLVRMAKVTRRGCHCPMGYEFCPRRDARTGDGLPAPA
ncbi:MAG: helix-turn-helix transcriptional regulator [Verrucomicrobia bacterium]|nr:helix-turn-helix transcriptional regulator [Verrucomicrobiota bacterium]